MTSPNHTYLMIEYRSPTLTPTEGSQRRCYNGCFHPDDWEETWTAWAWLNLKLTPEQAEEKLQFWRDLNASAVKARGPGARKEYRVVPDTVYDGTW